MADREPASWIGTPSDLADLLYNHRNRKHFRSVAVNSTTPSQAPTAWTNITAGGTQTAVSDSGKRYINGATAATTGLISGRVSGGIVQILSRPVVAGTLMTGSSFADVRWWAGVDDGAGLDGSDTPVESLIMFRATSGTTHWHLCTSDATTFTAVNTGIEVAVSTRYCWQIAVPGDGYAYGRIASGTNRLSGWWRVSMPTALSSYASDMSVLTAVENKANSAKAIRWGSWYAEWD